ncbi:hypothetical protein GCK32_020931, partial [Trichostrongylus colubriformis]
MIIFRFSIFQGNLSSAYISFGAKEPREIPSSSIETTPRSAGDDLLQVTVRKGQSSPSISRLHPTETVRSLGALPSSLTMPSHLGGDCYSSTEYVEYAERQFDDD